MTRVAQEHFGNLKAIESRMSATAVRVPRIGGHETAATTLSHSILPKTVYSLPLRDLPGEIVDPGVLATPCRLRFVDSAAFLDRDELLILECHTPSLDDLSADISRMFLYTAISYPWRDLQLEAGCTSPSFSVAGAEHADPISIGILRTACVAARAYGYEMLWVDRLCMLQGSDEDKTWQIMRMFRIYSDCSLCLIFPGGLVRLARLDDSTFWIQRAWTLQEAVAPGMRKLKVVFQLTHSSLDAFIKHRCDIEHWSQQTRDDIFSGPQYAQFVDKILEEGISATCDMRLLLQSLDTLHTRIMFHAPEIARDPTKYPIRILPSVEAKRLSTVVRNKGWTLWTAAYTRSSSRPVDMVFSLMPLLGIRLNVANFQKDDRMKATIAMIQALMRRPSAKATWLYIAPHMPPSRELSTLPEMPETSESGPAYVHTPQGRILSSDAIGTGVWNAAGAPMGEMTDAGYFIFSANGALLALTTTESSSRLNDENSETWAIVIGRSIELDHNVDWEVQRDGMSRGGKPQCYAALTLMLVERHGPELYHRVGMEREIDERKTAGWSWIHREFRVGGPGRGDRRRFGVSNDGPVYNTMNIETVAPVPPTPVAAAATKGHSTRAPPAQAPTSNAMPTPRSSTPARTHALSPIVRVSPPITQSFQSPTEMVPATQPPTSLPILPSPPAPPARNLTDLLQERSAQQISSPPKFDTTRSMMSRTGEPGPVKLGDSQSISPGMYHMMLDR